MTPCPKPGARRRVIADIDPAMGIPFRDVDDALALLLLTASPNIDLVAATVNFGNAPVDRGCEIAEDVLRRAGATVPVFRGAAGASEIGRPSPAVDALIRLVRERPGTISLVAVAPLTNVATAMMLDHRFADDLCELVVMGGSLEFGPFARWGEFNFRSDPVAAKVVLSSPVPKTIITMDLCTQAVFTKREIALLEAKGGPMQKWIADRIKVWRFVNSAVFRSGGFYPWDAVAAARVIDPSLFEERPLFLRTRPWGRRRGSIASYREAENFHDDGGETPFDVPRRFDADRFMKMFMDALLSL